MSRQRTGPLLFEQWSSERAALNHDFLQNRLLTAIAGLLQRIKKGEELRVGDVQRRLDSWSRYRDRLRAMIRAASDAVRPSQLLDSPELAGLPASHRTWVAQLVDSVEEARSSVSQRAAAIDRQLDEIDRGIQRVRSDSIADDLQRLYQAISEMSRAISNLPSQLDV